MTREMREIFVHTTTMQFSYGCREPQQLYVTYVNVRVYIFMGAYPENFSVAARSSLI